MMYVGTALDKPATAEEPIQAARLDWQVKKLRAGLESLLRESFLPPNDPRAIFFAARTTREEEAGLYHDPSKIGLRVQWLTLLKRLELCYDGRSLISVGKPHSKSLRWKPDRLKSKDIELPSNATISQGP